MLCCLRSRQEVCGGVARGAQQPILKGGVQGVSPLQSSSGAATQSHMPLPPVLGNQWVPGVLVEGGSAERMGPWSGS